MKIVDRNTGRQVADTESESSKALREKNAPLRQAREGADAEVKANKARQDLGWFGKGGGKHRKK